MTSSYKICQTLDDVYELIGYVYQTGYASIDFETSNLEYFEPTEYPTILGISFQPGSAWVIPLGHFDSPFRDNYPQILKILKPMIEDPKIVKIAWNAKYEYKWLGRYGIEPMGRFFDAMLLKYLLKEDRPHDLESMVDIFLPDFAGYGLPGKKGKKFRWDMVPLEELSKYCALDCDNTLRLFLHMEHRVIEHGFYPLFRNLYSMLVRVLGKCESTGMIIDLPYLQGLITKYTTLIKDNEYDIRNLKVIRRYERRRLKSVKAKMLDTLNNEIDKLTAEGKTTQVNNRINKIANITAGNFTTNKEREMLAPMNFGSPPQMAEFLFENDHGLLLPVLERTDSGAPSTAEETLIKLKEYDDTGFMDKLLKYRELQKLNSTYIEGMLAHVSTNNKVHTSYKINGTVTARISSNKPNMQNVPRPTTNPDIKPMFISPPGYALVELDYSQAELRVVAELANEKQMIQWFNEGHNIHVAVAAKVNKTPYEIAYPITKDEDHPQYEEWTIKKKAAKTINFGILYEQGPGKLAEKLGCSKSEAAQFRKEWLQTFPAIARWIDKQHKFAKKNGYVYNIWGFKRRLPDIYSLNKGKAMEAERQSVNCVDALTEALSITGWKNYSELKEGELILTKNPITSILEWQPILKLNIYPNYQGKLYHFSNHSFDALTTSEHRWLTNKGTKNFNKQFLTTKELFNSKRVTPIHRSGEYIPSTGGVDCPDEYLELLGIILTDGHIRKYGDMAKPRFGKIHGISICQSMRANPEKVKRIDYLLNELGIKYRRKLRWGHTIYWGLSKQVAEEVNCFIPDKLLTMDFLLSLNTEQLVSLQKGMVMGDGVRGGDAIVTGNQEQVNLIQVLNIMCGNYSNINTRDSIGRKSYGNVNNKLGYVESKNISYQATIGRRKHFHHISSRGELNIKEIHSKQLVWCPTIHNETWVCRRNGKQYITGNSPIQGAASLFTLFSGVVLEEMRLQGRLPLDYPMVYTVHDSLGFYVRFDKIHEFHDIAVPVMANPQTQEFFGFQMKKVNMKASMELGLNWGRLHDYSSKTDYTKWASIQSTNSKT